MRQATESWDSLGEYNTAIVQADEYVDRSAMNYSISTDTLIHRLNAIDEGETITVANMNKDINFLKGDIFAQYDEAHTLQNESGDRIRQFIAQDSSHNFGYIGWTATPIAGMGNNYDRIIVGPTPRELMERGVLHDNYTIKQLPAIQSERMKYLKRHGVTDKSMKEARKKVVRSNEYIKDFMAHSEEYGSEQGEAAVFFCQNRVDSQWVMKQFEKKENKTFIHIDANVDKYVRSVCYKSLNDSGIALTAYQENYVYEFLQSYVDDLKLKSNASQLLTKILTGDFSGFTNIRILERGFDCPRVNFIGLLEAWNHYYMYVQALGRGARQHPDKIHLFIGDYAENSYIMPQHADPFINPYDWSNALTEYISDDERKKNENEFVQTHKICSGCGDMYPIADGGCECGYKPVTVELIERHAKNVREKSISLSDLKPKDRQPLVTIPEKRHYYALAKAIHEHVSNSEHELGRLWHDGDLDNLYKWTFNEAPDDLVKMNSKEVELPSKLSGKVYHNSFGKKNQRKDYEYVSLLSQAGPDYALFAEAVNTIMTRKSFGKNKR